MVETVGLVGFGVDTLILNVRYADKQFHPVKRDLDEALQVELDALQAEARRGEQPVVSSWAFNDTLLFMEPHGAGRQWRWLLTCRLLSLVVSRGKFGDVIAQVRLASEYLWSVSWVGDALAEVHRFLRSIFGEYIHLQVSEVHLCADLVGFDFAQVDYEHCFVSRVRKQSAIYTAGVDEVALDYRRVSSLRFSNHGAPISGIIYNKTLEIVQKSEKTWFYDYWRREKAGCVVWDGTSDVWRVEFRFRREFLRNLDKPIEGAYDFLAEIGSLWSYAAGQPAGGADGLPDGWLRLVIPTDDSNRSRWSVHPVWRLVQSAFRDAGEVELGPVVRQRVRQKNVERGLAAVIGYCSTLAAWLGGEYAASDADVSLLLRWLYEAGSEYLEEHMRDFLAEVQKKQKLYGATTA
jgi:hypothetical protein